MIMSQRFQLQTQMIYQLMKQSEFSLKNGTSITISTVITLLFYYMLKKDKHHNRYYHHHYGGDLGTGGGSFNKVFDLRLPKKGTPFLKDGLVHFGGTLAAFREQFSKLSREEVSSIHKMVISIQGNEIKKQGSCCIKTTVFCGLLLCFLPLLLFKCNCFNKNVQAIYEIPQASYSDLAFVISICINLEHLTMYIQDNLISPVKSSILETAVLNAPKINYFWISNCVHGLDLKQMEYSMFGDMFDKCQKSNKILFNFHWDDKHFKTPEADTTQENIQTGSVL